MLDSYCAVTHTQLGLAEHIDTPAVSFDELYRRLKPFVDQAASKYAWKNLGCIDVDDLKQTGYVTLWKVSHSYNPEKGHPIEHYARRAVVNAMLDECQRTRLLADDGIAESGEFDDGTQQFARDPGQSLEPGKEDPVFANYAGQEISGIVLHDSGPLTEAQRHLLDLLYWKDCNEREAASVIGVSQQAVSKQRRKVLEICRRHLGVVVH